MKYYLYRHIRLDKNEPFYIGRGTKSTRNYTTIKSYYSRAYCKSHRSNLWKSIVAKTNYEVEILFESDNIEFIKQKEIEFIALYGRIIKGDGILVNITEGGESLAGYKPTPEQCKAISERLKGKNNHNYGKRRELSLLFGVSKTKEHVEKSVKSKHENYFNEVIDIKTGEIYRNPKCAAETYNININTLRHYLNGTRINPTNLEFLDENKRPKKDLIDFHKDSVIILYTLTGVFYYSLKEVYELYGMSKDRLHKMLKGKQRNKTSLIYA